MADGSGEPAASIPAEGINESEYEDLEAPDDEEHVDSVNKDKRWRKVVKEGLMVPYRTIHASPSSFKTPNRKCFIPGRPIFIKITGIERGGVSTHLMNPNLYVIQIQHGSFTWTIRRRYKHFQHLHQQLQLFRVAMIVPVPTRTHRERRSSYKTSMSQIPIDETTGKSQGLPRFPKRPEALVASDQLEDRRKALEQYLQDLVKIRAFRNHHETLEFLEVSHLSFVHGLGGKGKEGVVKKRTGTTHTRRCTFGLCTCVNTSCLRMQRTCGDCCGQWQRRWLIVKDTFVAYVRPKDGRLHCVMLLDSEFEVSSGLYSSGEPNGVVIANLSRQLILKCWTKRRSKEWLDHLRSVANSEIGRGFIGPNRFISYAPVRQGIEAEWFVDGSSYMSAIADVLEAAHDEILISDWWLSPEIYMKRPILEGERWRLDKILQRKAREGVKIFVLLYKEVNLALGINSYYSKQKLVEQHPENIKVLRHPDHVSAGVLLWAHHEKLVVVDQNFAFVGGIDLCYGRWDDHVHRLADFGSVSASHPKLAGGYQTKMTSSKPLGGNHPMSILQLAKATNALTISTMVGAGGSGSPSPTPIHESSSLTDLEDLDEAQTTGEEAEEEMKATIADLKMSAIPNGKGRGGGDLENIAEIDETEEPSEGVVQENGDVPLKGETPPLERRNLMRKMTKVTRELREDGREWVHRHLRKKESHEDDSSDSEDEKARKSKKTEEGKRKDSTAHEPNRRGKRSTEKSTHTKIRKTMSESAAMGLKGSSKLWTGKDYANFIVKDFSDLDSPFTDLVDRSTTPRMPWHDIGVMVQGAAARDVARHFIQRWNAVKDEKVPLNHLYPYLLPKSYDMKNEAQMKSERKSTKVNCQIVRSMCQWSGGIRMVEESIQQSYIESIENAKHYIYIENQFFISLAVSNTVVTNRIGEALLQRILLAHREKTVFRVFVVIPLLPGFEGEVGTNRGIAIHAITHWNYSSICRGQDALIVRLQMAGVEDPSQYITFHGLRTHSELNGDLVTELIYVHSKLMIVDDLVVICGSANINDRSMTGKRDSEVCAIIHDETFRPSRMNGKEYQAGPFAQSLRKYLFREHLGLMEDDAVDIQDPISEDFYRNVWIKTSETNTSTYDRVFHCVPTDCCVNFNQLQSYQQEQELAVTDPDAARLLLKENIKGHLVSLPLQFLRDENLLPSAGTKEALMPTQLWT